jgi:peptidoglycan/xylan/chitin deacetylase (PgdA/CDA1 family)
VARLPILMYHNVSTDKSEGLTVSVEKLEEQFSFLAKEVYASYHLKELNKLEKLSSRKNIVISFDDAYLNQLNYVVPLLRKYKLKATFFVPLFYLGKTDEWNTSSLEIMNASQLKTLDPTIVELGFHSYYHKKYNELSDSEIMNDTALCLKAIQENALRFTKALAYPYGKYPRSKPEKEKFIKFLNEEKFFFGMRIGNRINHFPFKNPFEIQRLDIKGEYSLQKFKRKIRFGRIF